MTTYDLGAVVTLSVAITNPAGAPADATAVTCTVTLPDGTTATPTVSHPATGSYTCTYTPAAVGAYRVHWVATGSNASAKVDTFTIADPDHTPAATYSGDPADTDLDQVRFLLRDTDTAAPLLTDTEIEWLLTEWGDTRQAARAGAETLAARFAQSAVTSKRIGDLALTESYSEQSVTFARLAGMLAQQAGRVRSPASWTTPDQPEASFSSGQFDNG